MSEPKTQSVNEKNSSILQLTEQTSLECILCKLYIHIRNHFYCQLDFLLVFYLKRKAEDTVLKRERHA